MALIKTELSQYIKEEANKLGFSFTGISAATYLENQEPLLKQWLQEKLNGEMTYMENHLEKRLDPRLLVSNAKSVITVLQNYYPEHHQSGKSKYKISKYAYGKDYHHVIKKKLKKLLACIEKRTGTLQASIFVDSAPVMDKVWAQRSGLGWIGKNTCLINKKIGSFCFIGHIIANIELEYDSPYSHDFCGTCTRCIDACPTKAIIKPYIIKASKCISYLTIENKRELPPTSTHKLNNWIFGCDICQDVCPWNRFAKPHDEESLHPNHYLLKLKKENWESLNEKDFNKFFKDSAIKRTKYKGLMRNINAILKEEKVSMDYNKK